VLHFEPLRKLACAAFVARKRLLAALAAIAIVSLVAGFATARLSLSHPSWSSLSALPARFLTPSTMNASRHSPLYTPKTDPDDVSGLAPQLQAERLLARAIRGSESSLEQITIGADQWRGHIRETPSLFALVRKAFASDDLRVRNAAMEIDLAANGLGKTPQSVEHLTQQLRARPADRTWDLWRLGALGNRGVEPGTVLATLLHYVRDPEETTRLWAVEGLAALGTDSTINPLLDALRGDPSWKVRKSAAISLAESGMLTSDQRMSVIPDLLNFLDDDSLDTATRSLVYATLRGITGAALGNDASAWREWWATHDRPAKRYADPTLLRA
jgi:hypothetical protein